MPVVLAKENKYSTISNLKVNDVFKFVDDSDDKLYQLTKFENHEGLLLKYFCMNLVTQERFEIVFDITLGKVKIESLLYELVDKLYVDIFKFIYKSPEEIVFQYTEK